MSRVRKYVIGLMFSKDFSDVALIRKNRPAWQKGKLNGIGGKIESHELPIEAMIREFKEETGHNTSDWRFFCKLIVSNVEVHFFTTTGFLSELNSMTDEEIVIVNAREFHSYDNGIVQDLRWLIPMAMDKDKVRVVGHIE